MSTDTLAKLYTLPTPETLTPLRTLQLAVGDAQVHEFDVVFVLGRRKESGDMYVLGSTTPDVPNADALLLLELAKSNLLGQFVLV